jgi:hypothetical protein
VREGREEEIWAQEEREEVMAARIRLRGHASLLLLGLLAAMLASAMASSPALGAGSAGWLHLTSKAIPSNLAPGGEGTVSIAATNLGDADIEGSKAHPITLTDKLPAGVTATGVVPPCGDSPEPVCARHWPERKNVKYEPAECTVAAAEVSCAFPEGLSPYEQFEVRISVKVEAGVAPGTVDNVTTAEGEGLSIVPPPLHRPLTVSTSPTPFGVDRYELTPEDDHGAAATQAGSHPFQFSTAFGLNDEYHVFPQGIRLPSSPAPLRNLKVDLPAGFVGNANKSVIDQCTELQFTTVLKNSLANQCPPDTAVGVSVVRVTEPNLGVTLTVPEPVYNLVPAKGEPARFGFLALGTPVTLDTAVTEGDYHIVVNAANTPESVVLLESLVTVWGIPGDERHDQQRGSQCVAKGADAIEGEECLPPEPRNTSPFLTLPGSCTGPLQSSTAARSWLLGAGYTGTVNAVGTPAMTGCELLPFEPTMSVKPLEHQSNTPTGLAVTLKVPQSTILEEEGLAEADIRNTTVVLPEGVQLSPSAASGLAACTTAQMGYRGVGANGTFEFNSNPVACPDAAKVGKVRIKSPVLERELEGSVYLAAENDNPFNSLFGIYIVVEDETTGVRVKLAGKVTLDENTGRITNTFPNAPQLPFEELEVELFNGPRASVATPRSCGTFTTQTSFTPWSGTAAVNAQLDPNEFAIGSGPKGTPCASPQPFNPTFQAGAGNPQAAAFTPFTVSIGGPEGGPAKALKSDTDQALKSVTMTLPPGLSGLLSQVELCPEAQANAGTCGEKSLIGEATAVAGLGPDPFTVTGGKVYITGPYKGAPFGLSIVIPAKAGPFDFGIVVTRATINVNPSTAQITIANDVPTMLNSTTYHTGVPVQLRRIDVTVQRPGGAPFQFNPTNCSPLSITGTLGGDQGASAPISVPYQVTGCNNLPFSPQLSAVVGAQASKANGANFTVNVKSNGLGGANIQKVRLQLPLALPSRLTTIQKACLLVVFNANPATCPEGSNIGFATIHTPVLKNPLSGPAYLVSHGNEAFPDVEFVLQGEGVTIVLDGKTDIKKGITYSRFEAAPDAPFTTFETVLPAGPHSALTAFVPPSQNYNLCKTTLLMPTEIVAQNGDVIRQTTNIAKSGCKKTVKKLTRAQLLAKSLKACKKKHNKHKRQACERAARKKYGPKHAAKHKKRK